MKKYFKRYQYFSKDGIKWTPWFECREADTKEKWQLKNRLRNEFKIVEE